MHPDQIANMPKSSQTFFFASLDTAGIGEAPMGLVARMGKIRTRLCCLITDRHHQVHQQLIVELPQTLGAMIADIDTNLSYDLDGQRMDHARLGACTKHRSL